MKINHYGQVTVSEAEIFDALYSGNIHNIENVYISSNEIVDTFNQARQTNGDPFAELTSLIEPNVSLEEFDKINQKNWFMPDEYRTYDIVDWLYCECRTIEEKERVTEELKLFAQHNMIDLLKYLKYLVDTMKKNNVVWGVGRGSSVASYCLYLLEVHRINSIKYKLDIREFLK